MQMAVRVSLQSYTAPIAALSCIFLFYVNPITEYLGWIEYSNCLLKSNANLKCLLQPT